MTKIGSWLVWAFLYFVGLVLIINFPVPIIALYSLTYVVIYTIFEPILRDGIGGNYPSGKETGYSTEETIKTLLEYYEEREVIDWCMKNYKWNAEKAVKRVSTIADKKNQ